MSGLEDLAALLAIGQTQKQAIAASDPYLQMKSAPDAISQLVLQASANPEYSTKDKILAGLLSGAASGILGDFSEDYQARAADEYSKVLRAVGMGENVERPDVLSPSVFNLAKNQADIFKVGAKLKIQDQINDATSAGLKKRLETLGELKAKKEMADLARSELPTIPLSERPLSGLASGKDTTAQKVAQYFQEFVAQGMPPTQAATSARQQVEGELKASTKTYDEAKAAREYGQKLLDLASTARAGMSQAGQTGNFQGIAHNYERIAALLGSDEAAKQLTGDAVLDSIAPEIVKMSRSPGAVSDYETRLYLGAGPNTRQRPETNAILTKKMEDIGKLNLDYADFLDTYREVNGTTTGAAKKWSEYRQAFPLFVGEGEKIELNPNRPSWQDYFNAIGEQAGATAETEATISAADQARALLRARGIPGY